MYIVLKNNTFEDSTRVSPYVYKADLVEDFLQEKLASRNIVFAGAASNKDTITTTTIGAVSIHEKTIYQCVKKTRLGWFSTYDVIEADVIGWIFDDASPALTATIRDELCRTGLKYTGEAKNLADTYTDFTLYENHGGLHLCVLTKNQGMWFEDANITPTCIIEAPAMGEPEQCLNDDSYNIITNTDNNILFQINELTQQVRQLLVIMNNNKATLDSIKSTSIDILERQDATNALIEMSGLTGKAQHQPRAKAPCRQPSGVLSPKIISNMNDCFAEIKLRAMKYNAGSEDSSV
jgi:hypothetical protein